MVVAKDSETVLNIYQRDPELFNQLNQKPARITLNGKRHYNTPFYTGPAASVTTIISETASETNNQIYLHLSSGIE